MRNHWAEIEKYLEDQKIAQELIGELRDFHMRYEVEDQVKERVEKPDILFYGKKILEMSIAALLRFQNICSIHCSFAFAGAYQCMNLINKQDYITF